MQMLSLIIFPILRARIREAGFFTLNPQLISGHEVGSPNVPMTLQEVPCVCLTLLHPTAPSAMPHTSVCLINTFSMNREQDTSKDMSSLWERAL